MRLSELQERLGAIISVERLRSLFQPAEIEAEIRAEISEIASAALSREELEASVATLWVHYQALHAMFEDHFRTANSAIGVLREHVDQGADVRRRNSKASPATKRNPEWASDAVALWTEDPSMSAWKVAREIARLRSRPGYPVHASSVLRSIKDLAPTPSAS